MTTVWRADHHHIDQVSDLLIGFRDWMGRPAPSDERMRTGVRLLMSDPQTEYLLAAASEGGEPVGVCQLRFRHGLWFDATDCLLEDLYVRDEARGGGVGTALVRAAIARARERECARIELDADESNSPAVGLYEEMGFDAGPEGQRNLLMRREL